MEEENGALSLPWKLWSTSKLPQKRFCLTISLNRFMETNKQFPNEKHHDSSNVDVPKNTIASQSYSSSAGVGVEAIRTTPSLFAKEQPVANPLIAEWPLTRISWRRGARQIQRPLLVGHGGC